MKYMCIYTYMDVNIVMESYCLESYRTKWSYTT